MQCSVHRREGCVDRARSCVLRRGPKRPGNSGSGEESSQFCSMFQVENTWDRLRWPSCSRRPEPVKRLAWGEPVPVIIP